MTTILIVTIVITVLISIKGFSDMSFFEKFKFNVGAVNNKKEYIRLISAGFLHADYMHLFMNMLTLYFFAPIVIHVNGTINYLLIYLGAIIAGNLFCLYYYKNQPWYSAIGASGGVSGILFAAVAIDPVSISVNFIPGYLFGAIYFGFSVYSMLNPRAQDNIGHAAHLGGAAFGLVMAILLDTQNAISNILYLGIMSLPLIYLGYEIFIKKRIG